VAGLIIAFSNLRCITLNVSDYFDPVSDSQCTTVVAGEADFAGAECLFRSAFRRRHLQRHRRGFQESRTHGKTARAAIGHLDEPGIAVDVAVSK
jgi:hypothetical protein